MGKPLLPIGVIADTICGEIKDNTLSKKMQILQYIVLGHQQMHMLLNKDVSIKSEIIKMGGDMVFELPCGFMYETKIGIKRGNRINVLHLNRDLRPESNYMNDSESLECMQAVLWGESEPVHNDCYFYNVFQGGDYCCGSIGAVGYGYKNRGYYNIENGLLQISTYLPNDDEELELIIEYKSDGITQGLELVMSEAFLPLYYFAKAMYNQEGPNGEMRVMWESSFKTLKRIYNHRTLDVLTDIYP